MQEHNTTVWSFLQVVLEQVKLQHPHVTNDKGILFHGRLRRSIQEQIQLLQSVTILMIFIWKQSGTSHGKSACDGIGGTVKRPATKASLKNQLTIRF